MSPIPSDVIVTDLPDGVHYRFPLRRRGVFAWVGAAHLAGGIMGIVFMSFWVGAVGVNLHWPLQPQDGMLLLFLAAGIFMLLVTLRVAAHGLTRLIGHSEIELRGETLRGYECWGPLRWPWRRAVAGLIRLDIGDASIEKGSIRTYDAPGDATKYNVITPVWEDDVDQPLEKRKRLSWGYPRDWLIPVAEDLSQRCRLAAAEPSSLISAIGPAIPVEAGPLPNRVGFVEHLPQPAESKFEVENSPGVLRLTWPKNLTVEIEADKLRLWQRRWFSTREYTWSREQLADIRVGKIIDSDGPDTPLVLIRPHPGEGDLLRLSLAEETDARWLATLLRNTLALDDCNWQEPGGAFMERLESPAGSPIVLDHAPEGITFTLPAYGLRDKTARDYAFCAAVALSLAAGIAGFLIWQPNNRVFKAINHAGVFAILALTALLGGFSVLGGIQRATRNARLWLDPVGLHLRQSTLFGTNETMHPRSRILDIRVGCYVHRLASSLRQTIIDSGTAPWELQVHREGGERVGLLDGLKVEELQWIATILRHEILGIGDARE